MVTKNPYNEFGDKGEAVSKAYREWYEKQWTKVCRQLKKYDLSKIKIKCSEVLDEDSHS